MVIMIFLYTEDMAKDQCQAANSSAMSVPIFPKIFFSHKNRRLNVVHSSEVSRRHHIQRDTSYSTNPARDYIASSNYGLSEK